MIAAEPGSRGHTAALLGSAVKSLSADGLITPEVTIGWGETSAVALSATSAAIRLFALPSGRIGPALAPHDVQVMATSAEDGTTVESLLALGSLSANAIIAPSSSAARAVESDPALASRASDEPFVAIRFGCDDPLHDPASDHTLPANYSAASLDGKAECRRALARRGSLALGPRTLLLATTPLLRRPGWRGDPRGAGAPRRIRRRGGDPVRAATASWSSAPTSWRSSTRAASRVVGDDDPAEERRIRAAADAILLGDPDDRTGRAAGTALLYGTLPIAVDAAASRDFLVDYDPRSATGSAILFQGLGAVRDRERRSAAPSRCAPTPTSGRRS